MKKIIFNNCFGGFGLSDQVAQMYNEKMGTKFKSGVDMDYKVRRDDLVLIEIVEALKSKANGACAELAIAEVPDGAYWYIDEYDGAETVLYTLTPPPEVFSANIVFEEFKNEED